MEELPNTKKLRQLFLFFYKKTFGNPYFFTIFVSNIPS